MGEYENGYNKGMNDYYFGMTMSMNMTMIE